LAFYADLANVDLDTGNVVPEDSEVGLDHFETLFHSTHLSADMDFPGNGVSCDK
jgi:hypothetical protein